jgi:FkbM family methyltransferase
VLGRYKFLVDSRDEGLAPHLLLDGYWEFWVTDLICRTVRPGQIVFDVGANLGYYAVLMAELVGPAGRVHAVEPNPRLANLTRRNLALNGFTGWSRLHRVAASDRAGTTMRFLVSPSDPKNGRILGANEPSPPESEGFTELVVKGARLDDLCPDPVAFLKIDVEGAEEAVWNGMQGLLARSPDCIVLLEFNAGRCRDAAALLRDIAGRFPLRELGYDARIHPVSAETVLPRSEDTLLYLSRRTG